MKFEINDQVVMNGTRANGTSHAYGTTNIMEQWEKKSIVLTVFYCDEQSVVVGIGNDRVEFDHSELELYDPHKMDLIVTNKSLYEALIANHEHNMFKHGPNGDGTYTHSILRNKTEAAIKLFDAYMMG